MKLPHSFHFVLIFLFFQLFSCAQMRPVVCNTYSFYEQHLPGTIPFDANVEPAPIKPDTVLIIYVETTSKQISWENAWKDGKAFIIVSQSIVKAPYKAGTGKAGGNSIIITTQSNNYLWQLFLSPKKEMLTPPQSVKKAELLLKGTYRNKAVLQTILSPVELEAIPSV